MVKQVECPEELKVFFNKSPHELLEEIIDYNSVSDLYLEGNYQKVREFGFFTNISHVNGNILKYPVTNETIKNILVRTSELEDGSRYTFEVTIAKRRDRIKKGNPFLLLAKVENLGELKQLSFIKKELKEKREKLEEINQYLEKEEAYFEERKKDLEERIAKISFEKEEEYQSLISQKFTELKIKENEILSLNQIFETSNKHLMQMEKLLRSIKDRISLCRNLQFINEDDEKKYLNILTAKEFNSEGHLDFQNDFANNFSTLSEHVHSYLYFKKNLIYTRFQIKNFLTLLRTHDLIVLSGLSGSGKTQIVKAFAEALGGVAKIIPVKPNWTTSEDLIGYYNPLKMSFLPTPFTEAIVEAIYNPNQLYFICLDEMNLARVEYYFADFLSKLEERSKQPEIELYANHEEELFVSEFNTFLNLFESSVNETNIKSWQEFLLSEDARRGFVEMVGNTENESMLQLHTKMKRRLIDILKFPSTIKIPNNIRFIGAINVDETTHYFSPKILDRIHVVKFDNPLLYEDQISNWFDNLENERILKPVYVKPNLFSTRKETPAVNDSEFTYIKQKLKEINLKFLLPLNIDFGIRSIRQSINYAKLNKSTFDYGTISDISLNSVITQKIFPRLIFDGSEIARNGEAKIQVIKKFQMYLSNEFGSLYNSGIFDETDIGKSCSEYLKEMIDQAERNNFQVNFFA